jgi:hypothetical protein
MVLRLPQYPSRLDAACLLPHPCNAGRSGYRSGSRMPLTAGVIGSALVSSPAPGRTSDAAAGALEDPLSEMAFLGPPSSAYPPDPENYVFYRVGGGYTPRLVRTGGSMRPLARTLTRLPRHAIGQPQVTRLGAALMNDFAQDPVQPTIPQPRASGWVPKDVVRLVQVSGVACIRQGHVWPCSD